MTQSAFTAALLDPNLPVPDGLVDAQGRPAGRRFSVYRNNVANSLTEALAACFPVLEKLLGAEYFKALAGVFLRAHPPTSRVMMFYGDALSAFLEQFPPLAHLPYLPDIARLEQALRLSYHAADTSPIATETLAALSAEHFAAARLRLSPALRLVVSNFPIHGIWRANHDADADAPKMQAESVLILRPEFDAMPHLLPPGGARFIASLLAGNPVSTAVDAVETDFDLNATLALLIAGNAIIGLEDIAP